MIRRSTRIEHTFPKIAATGYERHSHPTRSYNCIAYAAGDIFSWWCPQAYWPTNATREMDLSSLISAYESEGVKSYEKANRKTAEPSDQHIPCPPVTRTGH